MAFETLGTTSSCYIIITVGNGREATICHMAFSINTSTTTSFASSSPNQITSDCYAPIGGGVTIGNGLAFKKGESVEIVDDRRAIGSRRRDERERKYAHSIGSAQLRKTRIRSSTTLKLLLSFPSLCLWSLSIISSVQDDD